nr:methyltransferase domain-containing protein [uncultured Eisenbergiella sp.]
MINEEWKQILEKKDVRQNLSKLRQEIKDKDMLQRLSVLIREEDGILPGLLYSEDAKTRKNTALLMGDLGRQEFLAPVFEAYLREEQRFVKSSYLAAIGRFDYEEYLQDMKSCLENLQKTEVTADNQKHLAEEMRELSGLIVRAEGIRIHRFTGWNETYDIILLTNRNFVDITQNELLSLAPGAITKPFGAGVKARVKNLNWVTKIRTYHELLFLIEGMETSPMDAQKMAERIVKSDLLDWLGKIHAGEAPYYFRVEMKSKKPLDEKSAFVKKLSAQVERLSERKLTNNTASYELELRIIENKEGQCNLLVKLFTWKDTRFSYRREVIPTSIRPVNAALTVALAAEYLKENAQVLDPFCGVGTMLIERYKAVKAGSTYGVDIQEDAIRKARRNTEAAGQIIHYINRDFFRFEHEYLFDEVITDMPFVIGRITEEEITDIYSHFFHVISDFLTPDALLVLYSHNKELVERFAPRNRFYIFKCFEISRKEGTYVFLLRQRK